MATVHAVIPVLMANGSTYCYATTSFEVTLDNPENAYDHDGYLMLKLKFDVPPNLKGLETSVQIPYKQLALRDQVRAVALPYVLPSEQQRPRKALARRTTAGDIEVTYEH